MALLGDHVRTATVTAESAVVTYRLTHDDVLKVAARNDEVRLRLEKQRDERLAREKTFH
jgi:CRP-like cAMP-binding protein